jgi:hypothetical protein
VLVHGCSAMPPLIRDEPVLIPSVVEEFAY